jgi:hypothetical protein
MKIAVAPPNHELSFGARRSLERAKAAPRVLAALTDPGAHAPTREIPSSPVCQEPRRGATAWPRTARTPAAPT